LLIMAGIVSRIPEATSRLLFDTTKSTQFLGLRLPALKESVWTLGGGQGSDVSFEKLVVLIFLFVAVVVAVIFITKGQRRIPTQSAKPVRGRRVYGGTRQYLPLRVNQAGVMPVIFAGSLLAIPAFLFGFMYKVTDAGLFSNLQNAFSRGSGYIYNVS